MPIIVACYYADVNVGLLLFDELVYDMRGSPRVGIKGGGMEALMDRLEDSVAEEGVRIVSAWAVVWGTHAELRDELFISGAWGYIGLPACAYIHDMCTQIAI